jgi:hypothetical protein
MEPINYMLDVKNPIEEAMRGYGLGRADIEQRQVMDMRAAAEARAASEFEMRRAEAERQRAQAEAMQAQLAGLRDMAISGTLTTDALNQFALNNASTFGEFQSAFEAMEAPRREADTQFGIQLSTSLLSGKTEVALAMLDERIAAAENAGDAQEAAALRANRKLVEIDPQGQGVATLALLTASGAIDAGVMDAIIKQTGQGGVDAANVQSTDYIGGIAVVTTMKDGTVQIKNAKTNEVVTGQAADDLLKEAADLEAQMAGGKAGAAEGAKLQAQADLGAVAAAAQEGGKAAIQLATEAYKQLGTVRSNIANLDRAIQLVEEEGANTGVIASKLPSWSASTIELENMQNVLGLDVIGAVTFGALSEGELALALNTALPTNLEEKELADWLRRKKTAQQKLSNYLSQQSRFFSRGYAPGQWFDFIDSGEKDMAAWMRANPPGSGQGTVAPAPTTAAPSGGGRLKFDENGDPIP